MGKIMKDQDTLAFDRLNTKRAYDVDGRLHVTKVNISKAAVNPYLGREIPGADHLGLDPDKVYMLFRDPSELKKAAQSFRNLPLLNKHIPVSADEPKKDAVVGSIGSDVEFIAPYLQASLCVWDAIAIAGIESGAQKQLSSAYRYTPVMTPGVHEGVAYDGVMTDIIGNHVALVEVGRAGSDVVVGDLNPFQQPMEYDPMKASRKAIAVKAALGAYLRPLIAQDAAIGDLGALVRGVTAATFAQDQARIVKDVSEKFTQADPETLANVIKLAADAEPDDEKDDKKPAQDEDDQREDESDEDYKKRMDAKKQAADEEDDKDKKDGKAMDAAIKSAISATEKATIQRMNAIRQAEKEVQPLIGEVVAQDSAEAVYKLALDAAKVDLAGVHPSAYGAMVRMLPKPGDVKQPRVAMDAELENTFAKQFPTAGKLVRG